MRLCSPLHDHLATARCTLAIQTAPLIRVPKLKEPSVAPPSPTRHSQRAKHRSFSVARGTKRPTLGTRESHAWLFFIGTWLFSTGAWDSVAPRVALCRRCLRLSQPSVGLLARRSALFVWNDPLQRRDQGRSRRPPAFTRPQTRSPPTQQRLFDLHAGRGRGLARTLRCAAGQAGRLS